jgi:hypothetical protein
MMLWVTVDRFGLVIGLTAPYNPQMQLTISVSGICSLQFAMAQTKSPLACSVLPCPLVMAYSGRHSPSSGIPDSPSVSATAVLSWLLHNYYFLKTTYCRLNICTPLKKASHLNFVKPQSNLLWLMVSQLVCLGVHHPSGPMTWFLLLSVVGLLMWDTLTDERRSI